MSRPSSIRFIAVGDLSFNGRIFAAAERSAAYNPFAQVADSWRGADLRLGNLESPITTRQRTSPAKCVLRGSPRAVEYLKYAGFDILSLANNHAMDFGVEGMEDTCVNLDEAGIAHVGAGDHEASAAAPRIIRVGEQSVGCLAFCLVTQHSALFATPTDWGVAAWRGAESLRAVSTLALEVDWVLVQLHWGDELCRLPSPMQRSIARQLVDSGANAVLGHHPHVLQPIEIIGQTPVCYSLGDFLFSDMYWRGRHADGEPFVSRYRLHPVSLHRGWAELELNSKGVPAITFNHACMDRDLVMRTKDTPEVRHAWMEFCDMLNAHNYEELYEDESSKSRRRLTCQRAWKHPLRRLDLLLFRLGLRR